MSLLKLDPYEKPSMGLLSSAHTLYRPRNSNPGPIGLESKRLIKMGVGTNI